MTVDPKLEHGLALLASDILRSNEVDRLIDLYGSTMTLQEAAFYIAGFYAAVAASEKNA